MKALRVSMLRTARVISLSAVWLVGCHEPAGDARLTAERTPGRVPTSSISRTPTEVSRTASYSLRTPDLELGAGGDVWFGAVADIAPIANGAFAVLDPVQGHIQIFGSDGRRSSIVGRPGPGPGELIEPWALSAVGSMLVVRQNVPDRAFTLFSLDGQLIATSPARPPGDWQRPRFRHPSLRFAGFLMGPEDVSRRLVAFDSTSFIHVLSPDEFAERDWTNPVEYDALPTYLIRYGLDAGPLDTLATLAGPATTVEQMLTGRRSTCIGWSRSRRRLGFA